MFSHQVHTKSWIKVLISTTTIIIWLFMQCTVLYKHTILMVDVMNIAKIVMQQVVWPTPMRTSINTSVSVSCARESYKLLIFTFSRIKCHTIFFLESIYKWIINDKSSFGHEPFIHEVEQSSTTVHFCQLPNTLFVILCLCLVLHGTELYPSDHKWLILQNVAKFLFFAEMTDLFIFCVRAYLIFLWWMIVYLIIVMQQTFLFFSQ